MSRLLVQIWQGESLVNFFVSVFANSPKSGRSSGEERVRRFISIVFCRTGQNALLKQSHRCRDTVKAERVAATNGGRRQLVHKMFTNTHPAFC